MNFKQDFEQMNGLSLGYCRAEDLQPSSWTDSENFKADEISLNKAEDDICFYAKDAFDSSPLVSLIGLRYPVDENAIEWEKRKVEYTPATFLQTNFQDLLKSECENKCSFLFSLHPKNIDKRNTVWHWQCAYICGSLTRLCAKEWIISRILPCRR